MPSLAPPIGISAHIVDGEGVPLAEYQIHDNNERRRQKPYSAVRYVEATSNQKFAIQVELGPGRYQPAPNMALIVNAMIDGYQVQCYLTGPDDATSETIRIGMSGQQSHTVDANGRVKYFLQPLRFSAIDTTTDPTAFESLERDSKRVDGVGKIVVEVLRLASLEGAPGPSPNAAKQKEILGSVHEKAMRTGSKTHEISFGNPERTIGNSGYHLGTYGRYKGDPPVARFVFKYRSREVIEMLMDSSEDVALPETFTTKLCRLAEAAKQGVRNMVPRSGLGMKVGESSASGEKSEDTERLLYGNV